MAEEFLHLKRHLPDLLRQPERCLSHEGLVELVCRDCPFWKEEEKDEYECGGFRLLLRLFQKGEVSLEGIARALGD